METDLGETGVGVFKLPSHFFAGLLPVVVTGGMGVGVSLLGTRKSILPLQEEGEPKP